MRAVETATLILLACVMLSSSAAADMGAVQSAIDQTPPATATAIDVPVNVALRYVFGSVSLTTSVAQSAVITAESCTGGDVYFEASKPSGTASSQEFPFSFAVVGGSCYTFQAITGAPTATVFVYGYHDILREEFEGRSHANATRLDMNATRTEQNDAQNATRTEQNDDQNLTISGKASHFYVDSTFCAHGETPDPPAIPGPEVWCPSNEFANETYEGQGHANATWCALPCAPGEGDFVGNEWFNGTWVWSPSFGNITALSLSVGWTNTTNLSAGDVTLQSALQLETEWDPYIPAVFWGALLVFFLYFRAWFPAAAVLLAFANAILPTPLWGLEASLMLAMIALVVHVALKEGFKPRDAGEKGDI